MHRFTLPVAALSDLTFLKVALFAMLFVSDVALVKTLLVHLFAGDEALDERLGDWRIPRSSYERISTADPLER